ncbi:MAG: restriction endonuclease subunit S [Dysosmobacter sp.]
MLEEQRKIGKLFDTLDNLITLHQRKCISFTVRAGRLISTVNKKRITSSWEQRKFDEVFDCTVPNNTLSRAELSYDEGTVLNVHYGDVLIKYGSVLDVQRTIFLAFRIDAEKDFNGALLQDGDVIIADTAEDETTGKACEIGNLQGSAIVSGLHTMVCRPRNRMALEYLGYYLNSNAYHYQLLPLMQGIKVLSLSRSNIQKTSVSYPIAVKEQQLIAYYFRQLDNLITLHQRKPFLMKWRTSDANRNQTNRLVL